MKYFSSIVLLCVMTLATASLIAFWASTQTCEAAFQVGSIYWIALAEVSRKTQEAAAFFLRGRGGLVASSTPDRTVLTSHPA